MEYLSWHSVLASELSKVSVQSMRGRRRRGWARTPRSPLLWLAEKALNCLNESSWCPLACCYPRLLLSFVSPTSHQLLARSGTRQCWDPLWAMRQLLLRRIEPLGTKRGAGRRLLTVLRLQRSQRCDLLPFVSRQRPPADLQTLLQIRGTRGIVDRHGGGHARGLPPRKKRKTTSSAEGSLSFVRTGLPSIAHGHVPSLT